MEKDRKTAKGLSAVWIISFLVFSIGSSIYTSYAQVFQGFAPADFTSPFHLLELGISVLYLLPLLFVILHFAKKADTARLRRIVIYMIVLMGIWSFFFAVSIILAYIAPETFAVIIA